MLSRHKVTFIACFSCVFPFIGIILTEENSCEFCLHSAVLLYVRGVWHLSFGSGHQRELCLMYLHSCRPQCPPCYLHLTVWEFSLREGRLPYCLHSERCSNPCRGRAISKFSRLCNVGLEFKQKSAVVNIEFLRCSWSHKQWQNACK